MQNLVKIRQSTAELLRIFNFLNGGRPPSWICYDVIADHPRLVFDGPNTRLTLIVFILCNILWFLYSPVWLEIAYPHPFWGSFWGILPPNQFRYCRNPQNVTPNLWQKHIVWAINCENTSTGSTWARAQEIIQYNQLGKKSQNRTISAVWGEAPRNGLKWKFALV